MCGRFFLLTHLNALKERFRIEETEYKQDPRYNIAPTTQVVTVIQDPIVKLVGMRWGLIPFWAKDTKIGNKMINARAETVDTNKVFRNPFKKRRCLILADGFYEWQKTGKVKRPMVIRMKDKEPFAMAGLYERWKAPTEKIIHSCTIITTEPNKELKPIHGRMPVILRPEFEMDWIDPENQDVQSLKTMLLPYHDNAFQTYEVSTYVNSPRNDSAQCIRPVS
ncbi:MAG: SOS response-associated peptidase [Candidatus Thorarchaeota archaeon]|jgi:putative SOS response-associated peptidase YedK